MSCEGKLESNFDFYEEDHGSNAESLPTDDKENGMDQPTYH